MFDLRELPDEPRTRLGRVAQRTGYPLEAVFLVAFAMEVTCRGLPETWWSPEARGPLPQDRPMRHLTAVEVCDAVCRCARYRVGDDAARIFHIWGLREGGDVGRIVYGLIAEGYGTATEDDQPEQFEKIPLRRLLNPVRVVWHSDD